MIELGAVPNDTTHIDRPNVGEGFVENEEVVIGESRQLHRLRAGARIGHDVPVLLKDALQRPAHRVIAAGNQCEWRTFQGQFHPASSSVARLAWRRFGALAS